MIYIITDKKEETEFFRGTEKEIVEYYLRYIEGNVSSLNRCIKDAANDGEDSTYEVFGRTLECVAKRSWN
jgi:hypothetical protein